MVQSTHLLIVDPQNDFCDLPESYCPTDPSAGSRLAPALPVAGAHADMQRTAAFIRRVMKTLTEITITLDSHQRVDIAHPTFWKTGSGSCVAPLTTIAAQQVRNGEYLPRDESALARTLAYLDDLEARGRYTLMVWPVHCEIGTWGHNVHADVRAAYNAWEESRIVTVTKVIKGDNPWTEHYSALEAEVPLPNDPATQLNQRLFEGLEKADRLMICGEASTHCVRATCEHLLEHLGDRSPARFSRITLLTDCMSPVAGFEVQQQQFFDQMVDLGVTLESSRAVAQQLCG